MIYLLHEVEWEGTDLFNGVNGNLVLQTSVSPLLDEFIVDLAGAEEDLGDLAGLAEAGPLSRIILWNSVPSSRSSNDDLHSGCLNKDLGVMITSGFLRI